MLTRARRTRDLFHRDGSRQLRPGDLRVLRNPGFLEKMRRTGRSRCMGCAQCCPGRFCRRGRSRWLSQVMRDLAQRRLRGRRPWLRSRALAGSSRSNRRAGIRAKSTMAFEAFRAVFGRCVAQFCRARMAHLARGAQCARAKASPIAAIRAACPYRCAIGGPSLKTPEIPTTLPTLDEILASGDPDDATAAFYLERIKPTRSTSIRFMPRPKGWASSRLSSRSMHALKERGARFVQLARSCRGDSIVTALPVCEVVRTSLPGRAGWISAQGRRSRTASRARYRL